MTYRQALRWLDSRVDYERSGATLRWQRLRNLDRIRRLLAAVGNPHRACEPETQNPKPETLRFIHIAGTKGKGSTAHFLAAALRALGFRVGLYTSPHLADLRERIQVDGVPIPPARLARHLTRLRGALTGWERAPARDSRGSGPGDPLHADGHRGQETAPTYFDLLTAAAFLEFRERGADWAVIETGLGGRLDSTNVVTPALTVLTPIDYDHTEVLGNSLSAIAREKAGILKRGTPLVCARLRPAARRVVEREARTRGVDAWRSGREMRLTSVRARGLHGVRFSARTPQRVWRGVRLAAAGRHQADNALLALASLDSLESDGCLRVDPARVRAALARTRIPGRLEVLGPPPRPSRNPKSGIQYPKTAASVVVLDVAHNAVAARVIARTLASEPRPRGGGMRVLLFAAAREKPARAMLQALARVTDAAVLARVDHPRMRPLPDLLTQARGLWKAPPVGAGSPVQGLSLAAALAGASGTVLVSGSFYLVGALARALHHSDGGFFLKLSAD